MKWDLIIFDCDGVLVDSEPIANRILSAMLGEIGLPMSYEETIRRFMGRSLPMCVALIEDMTGKPIPEHFTTDLRTRLHEAFERELQPMPGIREVLEQCTVPICVASNGQKQRVQTTLQLTGLLPYFEEHIFSASEVARGKPAPDLFLHAASTLGVIPEHCVVIEDTLLGVQAGVAAGMKVFGFAQLSDSVHLASEGAEIFHDMNELLPLLRR